MNEADSAFTNTGRHPFKHVGFDGWLGELPLLRRRKLWLPCAELSILCARRYFWIWSFTRHKRYGKDHVYWALHVIRGSVI